jgi:hypothetical protein
MVFQGSPSEESQEFGIPWIQSRGSAQKASRNAQISKIDRRKRARAAKAHRELNPGSCNGLFSEGFPTGVRGSCLARPYEPALQPASRFPLRAGPKATGKQTALVQLSKSSISHPLLQIAPEPAGTALCNLPRIAIARSESNRQPLWKAPFSVGKCYVAKPFLIACSTGLRPR